MIVDVHHHWMPKEHFRHIERYLELGETCTRVRAPTGEEIVQVVRDGITVFTPPELFTRLDEQVKHMDEAGVDKAVLSTAIWQEWNNMEMCGYINDELAKAVSQYPERFIGLAHVPPTEEHALDELDRAVKDLGFKGVSITTHFRGKYPDESEYWPFYKKVSKLGVPIFVHAASTPAEPGALKKYNQAVGLGRVLDHALATVRVMYGGVREEFPNMIFVMGHLGGAYIWTKGFLEHWDARLGVEAHSDPLAQMYFDTAPPIRGMPEYACALRVYGADKVMLGSDYPIRYGWMKDMVGVVNALGLDDRDREKVLGGNAARVFGIR